MPLFEFICRLTSRQSLAAGCLRPTACHPQVTPCNALTAKDLRPTTCYLPSPTSDSNCRNEKTTSSDRLILIDITELAQRLHVRPQARKWRCSHHTFQQVVGRCRERPTTSNIRPQPLRTEPQIERMLHELRQLGSGAHLRVRNSHAGS